MQLVCDLVCVSDSIFTPLSSPLLSLCVEPELFATRAYGSQSSSVRTWLGAHALSMSAETEHAVVICPLLLQAQFARFSAIFPKPVATWLFCFHVSVSGPFVGSEDMFVFKPCTVEKTSAVVCLQAAGLVHPNSVVCTWHVAPAESVLVRVTRVEQLAT